MAQAVAAELPWINSFVLEGEADQYAGSVFIEDVHQNEPIHKASLISAGNPAAASRTSLALDDPVWSPSWCRSRPKRRRPEIREGDKVDLTLGVGSATFLAGSLAVVPTPNPFDPRRLRGRGGAVR